ncbi:MAG: histidine kinase dimerization/phosphoacceptor domain -containing protein [Cyclobacteriaceae bacterium]
MKWTDIDSAIVYLSTKTAEAENNTKLQALFAIELSKAYNMKRDCDAIKLWYQRAEDLFSELGDRRGLAEVRYQEAYWHYCNGDYETALELTFRGLNAMESLGDDGGVALGHLRLARIYHFTYKLSNSAEAGELAGKGFEQVGDFVNAADAWSFAGHAYRVTKNHERAAISFKRSLELAKKSKVRGVLGMAYNDLAAFHKDTQEYDSGEFYFLKSLEMVDPTDERQIMVVKIGLCQNYLGAGEYEKCIAIAEQALTTVLKNEDIFYLSELPEYLAKAYEGLGQYDSAYKYMKMNSMYSDSLFTSNQTQALEDMRVKYETEKKEEQLASQEMNNVFIIAICLVLLILLGVLFLYYTKRQEKNKQLTQLNKELDKKNQQNQLLLKEIHHRVKNNLEMVKSLISLQSAQMEDSKTRDAMIASQNRVQSMGIIHQKLYQGDNLGSIEMKDYFLNLGEGILDSFKAEEKVQIECVMDDLELDIDTAVPLGLIVNELLTNAIKYAFPQNEDGVVHVSLRKELNTLVLDVADNGIGKNNQQPAQGTGFGSQLVQLLTTQLNGEMSEEVKQGTHISFKFKLDTAA